MPIAADAWLRPGRHPDEDPHRARAEDAANRYRSLIEAAPDALLVHFDGEIVFASAGMADLLGAPDVHSLVDQKLFHFVAARSIELAKRRMATVVHGQWPRAERLWLRRFDDSEVLVETWSSPTLWAGQVASQISAHLVETDTSLTVSALTVPDAVITTDIQFRVAAWSAGAEVLYGWTEDEVRGQLIGDVIGWGNEGESLEAAAIQLLETGAWRGTARQLKRDGSTVLVDASTSIIKSQDGDAVAVVSVNRELWPASNNSTTVAGVAEVTADLERALAADEIVVHYQPVVRLDDGSIVKVEALVRWQHPVLGLLPPARFMAAAEDSGIIVALGERVLIKACEAVAEYRRMKDPNLELAVNLSARQLTDPTLVKSVQAALDATGLPADALWLEVTETAVIEHTDHGIHALMALRDLGVRLAIDDFGTGHASLNYLKRLPVQMLKIDRSFVSAVGQDRFDTAIVRSVLGLAQELGLVVVAEGVETREQADALAAMGCELCQGFLYCRPVPANALPETCGDR